MALGRPRVAMLHVGRCGSTVVARLLEQNENITWDGEIFEPVIRRKLGGLDLGPEELLKQRIGVADGAYGFETKYLPSHHLRTLRLGLGDYLGLLDSLGFAHYVTLHRCNYLRRVVSGAIGRETKTWHTRSQSAPTVEPIVLDLQSVPFGPRKPLLRVFEEMEKGERDLEMLLQGRSRLDLSFEEHVRSDPMVAYEAICDFVGIPATPASVDLRPTNPQPLPMLIANYEEVVGALTGTRFEWMLEGEVTAP